MYPSCIYQFLFSKACVDVSTCGACMRFISSRRVCSGPSDGLLFFRASRRNEVHCWIRLYSMNTSTIWKDRGRHRRELERQKVGRTMLVDTCNLSKPFFELHVLLCCNYSCATPPSDINNTPAAVFLSDSSAQLH